MASKAFGGRTAGDGSNVMNHSPTPGRRTILLLLALWAGLFACALAVDWPVARWVQENTPIPRRNRPVWVHVLKTAGDFKYIAVVIGVAVAVHPARWRVGAFMLVSCAFSGLFYGTKWVFGRHRPSFALEPFTLHVFKDGLPGIVYAQNMSFPSGHACLSFATASGLAVLFPRGAIAFYAVAAALGVERVLEGAHYPSDVVAGAGFGVAAAWIALRLCAGWFGSDWRM